MARDDPTVYMRLPPDLKARLDAAASENRRSLTAEIVHRLNVSFAPSGQSEAPSVDTEALNGELSTLEQRRTALRMQALDAREQEVLTRHELEHQRARGADDATQADLSARVMRAAIQNVQAERELTQIEHQLAELREHLASIRAPGIGGAARRIKVD